MQATRITTYQRGVHAEVEMNPARNHTTCENLLHARLNQALLVLGIRGFLVRAFARGGTSQTRNLRRRHKYLASVLFLLDSLKQQKVAGNSARSDLIGKKQKTSICWSIIRTKRNTEANVILARLRAFGSVQSILLANNSTGRVTIMRLILRCCFKTY